MIPPDERTADDADEEASGADEPETGPPENAEVEPEAPGDDAEVEPETPREESEVTPEDDAEEEEEDEQSSDVNSPVIETATESEGDTKQPSGDGGGGEDLP